MTHTNARLFRKGQRHDKSSLSSNWSVSILVTAIVSDDTQNWLRFSEILFLNSKLNAPTGNASETLENKTMIIFSFSWILSKYRRVHLSTCISMVKPALFDADRNTVTWPYRVT
jgi:hypothetical protein